MQDDLTTRGKSSKKAGNGKWVQRQEAEMDNEAATPSTLAPHTTSTPTIQDESIMGMARGGKVDDLVATARTAYDNAVTRGSDLLSKVDLSRGTGVIREYPIQAAVGGLIVGFLLGAAFFGRRQE